MIPIINAEREIVGWTDVPPAIERNRLRHSEAERLLGGPIFCTEIGLTDPRQAARAGAPRGWRATWRCMALCCDERIGSLAQISCFLAPPALAGPASAGPAARTKSAAGQGHGGARSALAKAG